MHIADYPEAWVVDVEFETPPGMPQIPVCLVGRELKSGRPLSLWREELATLRSSPFRDDALVVTYFASEEVGTFLALGWKPPRYLLDLFVEFRCFSNGLIPMHGAGLVGACLHFGVDLMRATAKEALRSVVRRGGPWSASERRTILGYCTAEVEATCALLKRMEAGIDLARALQRGRHMPVVAAMERRGIPVDGDAYVGLVSTWPMVKRKLVEHFDDLGVFDGCVLNAARFGEIALARGVAWPRTRWGLPQLDHDTMGEMAEAHPWLRGVQRVRRALAQTNTIDLAIGSDRRARAPLSPFRAKTSRDQPSTSRYLLASSRWLRGLITPAVGHAIAYIDWSQHEVGIAAALSEDSAMVSAYASGDPYLTFAIDADLAPPSATMASHGRARSLAKTCTLGTQYGMGSETLARRIGSSPVHARGLLHSHRSAYPEFWRWSEAVVAAAYARGFVESVFGWRLRVTSHTTPPTLMNFPVQANGAEMLRIACMLGEDAGVEILAHAHDAVLIEASADQIDVKVTTMREAMSEASRIVLGGFELRTEVQIVHTSQRLLTDESREMWDCVMSLVEAT